MKELKKYIITFLWAWVSVFTYAFPASFRNVSIADGLSDLLVNAIYKDSLGYIWLGTGNSLERFDGNHFKHYPVLGSGEKLKRITSIVELPGNEIWVGNGYGLWRIHNDNLEKVASETVDSPVLSLLYDALSDELYIGTENGLFIYHNGIFRHRLLDENTFSVANAITGIVKDKDKLLWMSTRQGLFSLNLTDDQLTSYHNLENERHVCSFMGITAMDSDLYLATMEQGIIRFDKTNRQFSHYVNVGCNVISSLSNDGNNLLYVGTDGNGVHFIDTEKNKVVRSFKYDAKRDDGLHSNSVYSLLVDRDGLIWIGFYQQGFDYTLYQHDLFSTYSFLPAFDSKNLPVRSMCLRGSEKLIGSREGLYYINEQTGNVMKFAMPELRANMIFSILYYQDEYYVGTYGGGMYVINPGDLKIRDFELDSDFPFRNGHIFCLKEDENGTMWMGTSGGLFRYKKGKLFKHYTSANSNLPDDQIFELYFDSTNKGWICTEKGMAIWDPSTETIRTNVFPENFIHKEKIRAVYEDSEHQLYFFPDKGSLFMSDLGMKSYRFIYPDTPLTGRDGKFIVEDKEHWLWLGTDKGIFRYDKKDTFISYGYVDGVPDPVFTLTLPQMDEKGNLWFANSKGLLCMNASRLNEPQKGHDYGLIVTNLLVDGKESVQLKNRSNKIDLDYSQRNLTFCVSDFSYTSPTCMAYEYRLDGVDEDWKLLEGKSEITYFNLTPGGYMFRVRKVNESESEVQLSLHIGSLWFYWLIGSVMLVFIGGMWYLIKRKKVHRKSLEEKEKSSTNVNVTPNEEKTLSDEKYKTNRISQDECKRLAEALEKLMQEEKPYINPDLKSGDLAAALGTSQHTLSYLFNQYLKRSYYDYVTGYRIDEFKRLVKSGEYTKYTLDALSGLCGFNSRASFFRSFKKITGVTPNDYISHKG